MSIKGMRASLRAGVFALGVAATALSASVATAQIKEAKDVHVIFVTHGQANDVYWSVVKNGVEAAQAAMGSNVTPRANISPKTTFRMGTQPLLTRV